ncbi:hypothetical protein FSP39_008949 [Pinctada imbricata]|uniref:Uncharacterized protein n=1 Tax=Pinctada imbricata TaxID=66713 RepID=A0AA88YJ51_PINIB|nr:hypothetical protein FSP39_008949 [Pinctada imbricata]
MVSNSSLFQVSSQLKDANGNNIYIYGESEFTVLFNKGEFSHRFLICDLNQDGILGQDFLLKHVNKINLKNVTLHTKDNKEIKCWIGENGKSVFMVKAKENVIIPAQSGILLAVQIEENEELGPLAYFEGEQEVDRSRGTVIVPGIVNTKKNVVINIINTSDTPSEVKTNQLVGKCEPYEEKLETERVAKIQENKSTERQPRQPRQLGEHLKDLLERSSEHLNETERLKVETLLLKYQNVFSRSSEDARTESYTELIQGLLFRSDRLQGGYLSGREK